MHDTDGGLAFSATDLSRHLSCSHLTSLRRAVALDEIERPPPYDDPRADVLKQRGIEHERHLLEQFTAGGRTVETITAADAPFSHQDRANAAERTTEAMRRGVDVIYQGRLENEDGRWSGYPDFLLRVDTPSALGGWSYEVLDAKLARSAKGEALLQLLLYSDLLARVQGMEPAWMHLALGRGDGRAGARFRVVEYAAYYRAVRRRFEAHAAAPPETYPEPVDHCRLCEWKQSCAERRRADDHLSLVAGITRGQRRRLVARDVPTMTDLAALEVPVAPRIEGVGDGALARIREQARVQDQGRRERRHVHELIAPVEPDKGLAALPEPSDGDVFFDLEGDAFATDGGLEYLFGVAYRDDRYDAHWALDQQTEKRVFECFIDRVMAHWQQHPGFHIYHYGAYETTAVKRLMSRYATREEEVDRLLRGDVFVDLHRVVRQGLRASVERYSIKKLEPFYGFTRRVELRAATRALIRFEAALESGDANGAADGLRAEVEGYNRDDCLSTLWLAEWLEGCRGELEALTGQPVPRPALRDGERDQERESAAEIAALFETLTAGLPVDDTELNDDQRARRLLAHLLEFHRREEKSMWWEFFDRCGFTEEEHVEHRATLGALTHAGEVAQVKRSVIHRYRFPVQAHEFAVGDTPKNPATAESDEFKKGFCGTVVALDETARTIDLKRGRTSPVPHPAALVPLDAVNSKVLHESLFRLAQEVASSGFAAEQPAPCGIRPPAARAAALRSRGASWSGSPSTQRTGSRRPRRPRRPRRNAAGGRPPDRPAARPLRPAGPGAARQRQDVHRRADDPRSARPRAAGRGDRQQPQSDLQPARCGVRSGRPPAGRGRADPRPAGRHAGRAHTGRRPRDPEGEGRRRLPGRAHRPDRLQRSGGRGPLQWRGQPRRRHRMAVGARRDGRRRGRARHRRGGTDEPRQHPRRLPGGAEYRPARRSSPARSTDPGCPPPGRRRLRARPSARRIGDGRPVPRRLSRTHVAHAPRPLRVHHGAVLRGAPRDAPGAGPADGDRTGTAGRTGPAIQPVGACRQHERLGGGSRTRRCAAGRVARRPRRLDRQPRR